MSDFDLAQRAECGDFVAFERLYERYNPIALRVARAYLRNPIDAEDATAEVWLQLVQKRWRLDATRTPDDLSGFISTLAYCAAHALRYKRPIDRRKVSLDEGETPWRIERVRSCWPSPDQALLRLELRDRLQAAIGALSPQQRRVICLRCEHGLSTRTIADQLGVQPNTVIAHLKRGRAALRAALSGYVALPPRGSSTGIPKIRHPRDDQKAATT